MQITMNNRHDVVYEEMFDDLIREVFSFSFMPWFDLGLWDERYESYSIIENSRMLANICIFKTDMAVNGKRVHAHQFGAVATHKNERGKGFSRVLMQHILDKYPDTPSFLAANPSVSDFYPRFGFRSAALYSPIITFEINNAINPVKLAPSDKRVYQAINERTVYSNIVDSLNTQSVQMFHLLLDYPDGIYHLPQSNIIVVAEQHGDKLFIADVISPQTISFDDISKELPFSGIHRVEFGFCPDWLKVTPEWMPVDMTAHPFFIRGEWNLPEKYRFPSMSET